MHKMLCIPLVLLALLVVAPAPLAAQSIITVPSNQCVWRAGDDPAWAAPNLDESGWKPYSAAKLESGEAHVWVRCHADLSPLHGLAHPAIQVNYHDAYRLFVNGEPVGGAGDLRSGDFSMNSIQSFALPKPPAQSAVIALRVTYRYAILAAPAWLSTLTVQAGDAGALRDRRASILLAQSSNQSKTTIYYGVIGVFGFVLLGLHLNDRSRSELLLLSLDCIGLAIIYLNEAASLALLDYSAIAFTVIFSVGTVLAGVFQPWFFFRLAGRRVPLLLWVIIGLAIQDHALWIPMAFLSVGASLRLAEFYLHWAGPVGFIFRVAMGVVPFIAFWPYSRITRRLRPLAILCMVYGVNLFLFFFVRMTSLNFPGLPNLSPRWGVTVRDTEPISTFLVIAALMWLLFREQRQVADERAMLAGEMQAARAVQQVIIPEAIPSVPGFTLEGVYKPAGEVGGDFFQIIATKNGGVLAVIGDVSGKGMPAALTVSLLVGTVRTLAHYTQSPGEILAAMNTRMLGRGQGGFTTCLVLRVDADRAVTVANAGHLPPYVNCEEMKTENGLPLGLAANTNYAESTFTLEHGARITLLTDGVVEARNRSGELFGFDRTAAIARLDANQIARAAEQFGQNDDITVLTLVCTA